MAYVVVRHRVRNFADWKPVFDAHADLRAKSGCKGGQLFRSAGDPNEIVVLFEWDTLENARRFSQSEDLRAAMAKAGVLGPPEFQMLDRVEPFPR